MWLVDWEDAGWGPPLADAVRYLVADRSLKGTSLLATSRMIRQTFDEDSVDIEEVANFWLQHRNFQPGHGDRVLSRQKVRDAARGAREVNALRILARG